MKNNTLKITLTTKDIKEDCTASGRLIDKVAMAIGSWTQDELEDNNNFYENESQDYVIKEFDFEAAYITWLNKLSNADKWAAMFLKFDYPDYKKSDLLLGAWTALNRPEFFAESLKDWKAELMEELPVGSGSGVLEDQAPELYKALEEARDSFWKQLHHEWLYGDRSEPGLIRDFERWLVGSYHDINVNYDEKSDSMTIEISEENATDFCNNWDVAISVTAKQFKEMLCMVIGEKIELTHNREQAERAKRRAEYEKTAAYKEERAKVEEAERRAKLSAMKR